MQLSIGGSDCYDSGRRSWVDIISVNTRSSDGVNANFFVEEFGDGLDRKRT